MLEKGLEMMFRPRRSDHPRGVAGTACAGGIAALFAGSIEAVSAGRRFHFRWVQGLRQARGHDAHDLDVRLIGMVPIHRVEGGAE
ncbi:MAG: hypothetical protein ACYSUU_11460 [Planctomycetota bacterium]|jgi:hypothetical protein